MVTICLKALANNRFVSAWLEENGNAPLIANAPHIREWELFECQRITRPFSNSRTLN